MFLKSIRIRHYKSLADVQLLDLTPVTLLVGPNAVGKSNIVDGLRFLRDIVTDGLDHAVSKRGGIGVIRQYSPTKPYQISVAIEYSDAGEKAAAIGGNYELTIASLTAGNFRVERETASWYEEFFAFEESKDTWLSQGLKQHHFERSAGGELSVDGQADKKHRLLPDQLALGSRFMMGPIGRPILQLLSGFRFSALYPNTLREPSRPETDRTLKESGENWASILKALKKSPRGREALERILETMRMVVPNLQDVTVRTVGGYLVPQFRVKNSPKAMHDFDPVQLSDGTLRIFGILLALYQIPAPFFIALEEPEQTVHPAILATLAEAFREVSERTQLLITSHSPHLVDFIRPEEIRVVSMKNGKTLVSPIKATQTEAVKEQLISLQELMTAEGLQPEDA
ncbi:MAG: AAA family ATPase [Burkholderiales bacterium]